MGKLLMRHTAHSVNQIGLHLVWCTKYRNAVLTDGADIAVKETIGATCATYGWLCHSIEVMPDHVHLFIQTGHTDAPVNVAKTLKSVTAVAVFAKFPKLKQKRFWGSGLWSEGSFYSSIGNVSQETILKYIEEQKQKK
jgi:putative transposase